MPGNVKFICLITAALIVNCLWGHSALCACRQMYSKTLSSASSSLKRGHTPEVFTSSEKYGKQNRWNRIKNKTKLKSFWLKIGSFWELIAICRECSYKQHIKCTNLHRKDKFFTEGFWPQFTFRNKDHVLCLSQNFPKFHSLYEVKELCICLSQKTYDYSHLTLSKDLEVFTSPAAYTWGKPRNFSTF